MPQRCPATLMTDTRSARSFRRWKRSLATCWIAASPMPVIAATTPPPDHKFKVYTTGQKRRLTPQIKREFKRRAAIEPVIGHLKEHHRMGRNHLAHASGDAINAVLAAAGYNFRRLLAWLRLFLLRILIALGSSNCPETEFFTDDSFVPRPNAYTPRSGHAAHPVYV